MLGWLRGENGGSRPYLVFIRLWLIPATEYQRNNLNSNIMRTFVDKFDDLFNVLGNSEQVTIFNEWACETGNECIYYAEEFDEVMDGFTPMRIACMVRYGDFNPHCDYFTFDGYGNFESIDNAAEYIDDYVFDMASYYEDHEDRLADLAGDAWDEVNEEEE